MRLFIIIAFIFWSSWSYAQEKWVGLQSSFGNQSMFPFNSGSYNYEYKSLGIYYKWQWKEKGKWEFNFFLQPTYYHAQHQLTNPWYKLDERDEAYALKIPEYEQPKTIREYVFNVGFLPAYSIHPNIQLIGLANIGPMYSDTETERLATGLAFSDIAAIGVLFHLRKWELGVQAGIRHVSNANILFPNNGHNASFVGINMGYGL